MASGGSWSVVLVQRRASCSSEIARGLDIFELTPSAFISQNEIDAAKTVHLDYLNAQDQPKFVWPPSFALARAYLDQLERSQRPAGGADRGGAGGARDAPESASGDGARPALTPLAPQLDADAGGPPTRRRCGRWRAR